MLVSVVINEHGFLDLGHLNLAWANKILSVSGPKKWATNFQNSKNPWIGGVFFTDIC